MIAVFVNKIYNFIYSMFYDVFYDISCDFTSYEDIPYFRAEGIGFYDTINFCIEIVCYISIILIIGLFMYFIYRLIIFIVRRFINV